MLKNKKTQMVLLIAALLLGVMALWSQQVERTQTVKPVVKVTSGLPQSLQNPANKNKDVSVYMGSSLKNEFNRADKSLNRLQKAAEKRKAIGNATAHVAGVEVERVTPDMLRSLGLEKEAAQLEALLQKEKEATRHVNFAGGIAKELVKNEVEDFIYKLHMVGKIGEYVVNELRDQRSANGR